MWIFLPESFLSIVADRDSDATLLVRARRKGDIERVFPEATPWEDEYADYRYRAKVPRKHVADALVDHALKLTYDNFKNMVHEEKRHDAYCDVWRAMYRWQSQSHARG